MRHNETIVSRAKKLFHTALKIWTLPEKYNIQKDTANIIDYSAPYSIQANVNITGEKPKQLIIFGAEYSVSTWKDLLRTLCRVLFELDSTVLYNLIKHKDFVGRERCIISDSSEQMRTPHRISNGLYIETNLSALDILNYCKIICNHYQISEDVYFMLNRKA